VSAPPPESDPAVAFGRALGFVIAAAGCLIGGGMLLIAAAGIFFRFLYGG
jgi:hypothetical protein